MKLNQDKCHLLFSGYKHENVWARIVEVKIWESLKQKLLGVVIDRDLSFIEYVSSLCKKAVRKVSVLSRLSRSSHPEVFCKKGVLRNFAKFTGKPLCQSLFFNKVPSKKGTLAQVFSCEFCEISKDTFSYKTPPVAASDYQI